MLIDTLVGIFGHNLPAFALLFIGIVVEKYYVSRITVFTNVLALNIHFLNIAQTPHLMIWYGDLGLLLGIYGMTAYLLKAKTSILYNLPAFTLFSSLPVALVILSSPSSFVFALILGVVINFGGGLLLSELLGAEITHWGPRHGEVSRFIRTARMEYVDAYGVLQKVDLDVGFEP